MTSVSSGSIEKFLMPPIMTCPSSTSGDAAAEARKQKKFFEKLSRGRKIEVPEKGETKLWVIES